jgi:hypothetical protein
MQSYLKKNIIISLSLATFTFLALPVVSQYTGASFLNEAQAKEGHDSNSGGGSGHKGNGPKYKGGRGSEGHGGADTSHKGSSSHGGGSKTLEETVFKSDGGHTTSGDAGHKGGSSGAGGKKYMGGGKGGHEEAEGGEGGHEETKDGADTAE